MRSIQSVDLQRKRGKNKKTLFHLSFKPLKASTTNLKLLDYYGFLHVLKGTVFRYQHCILLKTVFSGCHWTNTAISHPGRTLGGGGNKKTFYTNKNAIFLNVVRGDSPVIGNIFSINKYIEIMLWFFFAKIVIAMYTVIISRITAKTINKIK